MPKKRVAKKQTGKGMKEIADAVHSFVKDNRLISRGLGIVSPGMGQIVGLAGYGRKRRAPRRAAAPKLRMVGRGQVGAGIFSDIGGGLGSVFGGLGGRIGSVAHGFFGAGRSQPASASRRSAISI